MVRITKTKFLAWAGLLALLCVLWTPAAYADGLTITLTTSLTGSAGHTITVFGDLANTSSSPLFFSSDTPNIKNTAMLGFGDLGINAILGFGPSFVDANSTLTGVDLFTLVILPSAAPGHYTGNLYNIAGGTDQSCAGGTCQTVLDTASFDVTVQGPVGVPEPGTRTLLAAAMLAAAALFLLRRAA